MSGCFIAVVGGVVEVDVVCMCSNFSLSRCGDMMIDNVWKVVCLMPLPWMRMGISFSTGGEETNMVHQFLISTQCVDVIGVLLI